MPWDLQYMLSIFSFVDHAVVHMAANGQCESSVSLCSALEQYPKAHGVLRQCKIALVTEVTQKTGVSVTH